MELRDMKLEVDDFMKRLRAVSGVIKVDLTRKGSKESQGNPDTHPNDPTKGHRQQQRFEVYYEKYPDHPVEFELTRST